MLDQVFFLTGLLLLYVHLVLLHLEDFLTDDLKLLKLRCHYCLVSRVHLPKPKSLITGPKQPASPCTAGFPRRQMGGWPPSGGMCGGTLTVMLAGLVLASL